MLETYAIRSSHKVRKRSNFDGMIAKSLFCVVSKHYVRLVEDWLSDTIKSSGIASGASSGNHLSELYLRAFLSEILGLHPDVANGWLSRRIAFQGGEEARGEITFPNLFDLFSFVELGRSSRIKLR